MSPRAGIDLYTILQAATEIADTQGFDEVTLASLAKKLEIRSPSLYNHVDGLHGLRKKLAIYALEQLNNSMTNAAIGRSGDDAVRTISEAYVKFVRMHPGLYEATLRIPDPQDPDIQKAGSTSVELVIRVLDAYGLEEEMALHVTRGLRCILHGFTSLEQKGGFGMSLDLDVSFRLMIDTFLAGIHKLKAD